METIIKDTSTHTSLQAMEELGLRFRDTFSRNDLTVSISIKENAMFHGTWAVEQRILGYIREGDPAGIRHFFEELSAGAELNIGSLANTPLRQEKNIFIGLVTLIGKTAAIEGGIDIEDSYRLIDLYIRKCEDLGTVEEVYALRYYMILDFAERVSTVKLPTGLSLNTLKALHYISEHLYTDIRLSDVADFVGISRSTLTKSFRQDMAESLISYVNRQKIKEAQRLLLYSDLSISAIAEYLSFSSQPYFQTVFKKVTGQTPKEYRCASGDLH